MEALVTKNAMIAKKELVTKNAGMTKGKSLLVRLYN